LIAIELVKTTALAVLGALALSLLQAHPAPNWYCIRRSAAGLVAISNEVHAAELAQAGKLYIEAGRYDVAETKLHQAVMIDPSNAAAHYYLKLVLEKSTNGHSYSSVYSYVRTNFVRTTKARDRIYQKLDNILMGDLTYDGLTLPQVIETLGKDALYRDPEKRGVNMIIAPNADPQASAAPAVDPATGLPIVPAAGGGGESDLVATTIRLVPAVRGLTLRQALDVIVKVADRPIKYSVEDFGVVFSYGKPTTALHTRWFRVDPDTFAKGLHGVLALDFSGPPGSYAGGSSGGGSGFIGGNVRGNIAPGALSTWAGSYPDRQGGGINFLKAQTSGDITVTAVRTYFQMAGVPLEPPKSVHFNDRLGLLMVRATLADLDLIEQAVQVLSPIPPQELPGMAKTALTNVAASNAVERFLVIASAADRTNFYSQADEDTTHANGTQPGEIESTPPPVETTGCRLAVKSSMGAVRLTWTGEPGARYQVQTSPDLTTWTNVGAPRLSGSVEDTLTYPQSGSAGYFRLVKFP